MKKVVTFGEIMLRLAPQGFLRFSQANNFDVIRRRRIQCSSFT